MRHNNLIPLLPSLILLFALFFSSPADAQLQETTAQKPSLSLSDAIEKALANNYGIILSELDTQIAEVNNSWGNAGRYPTVSMTVGSTNGLSLASENQSGSNRLSGGLAMNWILFDGFRVRWTKDQLEKLEELTKGRSAVIVENTIQDVIEMYYLALLQKEQLQVYQKVTELSKDRFEAEEALMEFGGTVSYKVLQAKNTFLDDQYQLLNQQILVQTTMRNLNFLMAEDSGSGWELSDPFEHVAHDFDAADLLNKMQSNNRTIQNQYIQLEISQLAQKQARSAYMPTVRFNAGIDHTFSNQFVFGQGNSTGFATGPYGNLTLSYNLYTGGNRERAADIAAIGEKATSLEGDEMIHLVSNQLLNEFDAYEVRKMQLEVATESLEAAELNLDIAAEKLRTGAINSFNYRDIQLIYLNSAIQRLQAIYALIRSHTNLTRLTGGFVSEN